MPDNTHIIKEDANKLINIPCFLSFRTMRVCLNVFQLIIDEEKDKNRVTEEE